MIIELNLNLIEQTATLLVDFFHELQVDTNDVYFQCDNIPIDRIKILLSEINCDENSIGYLVLNDDIPIGFILGQIKENIFPFSNIPKVGYLLGAYIKKEHRNKGIMGLLENKLMDFFKTKNIDYVDLNVLSENKSGKKSWEKLGYSTFREQMRKKIK